MKLAVTDASIFIDLLLCDACNAFFQLPHNIITSYQVWMELDQDQREFLSTWVEKEKLTIVEIEENFIDETDPFNLSMSLSIADRSVWFLAKKESALLLTSDGVLRKMGRKHKIKTHGLLWAFDRMVMENTLTTDEAIVKLEQVFEHNLYYRRNEKLLHAFENLKKNWSH
ncbi:MAG: hypothetical protein K9N46_01780 [Candidatus Marinimicrobia bacterium]|nr:hypothetical protein [Candidatus Neomarinimicrobiota bacterium]MCF7827793.1 hypothetical protein [Candidatus Neomarinimicrobiota bacterium]MCF7879452.1 hypothetical protein [Candidatus Neomarinimicrobiota bacterium]